MTAPSRATPTMAPLPEPVARQAFVPTPRQELLWKIFAATPVGGRAIIGYGGAAGGGKTRGLGEFAQDLALDFPGNRILIARKDFADLRETTMMQFDMHIDRSLVVASNNQEHWRRIRKREWPPDVYSEVIFRELKDYLGLGSAEYGAVIIDEAGEVPRASALMLLSRLRWKLPPASQAAGFAMKYAFVAASNPWPGWFKEWFVERKLPEELLRETATSLHFIPALAKDNKYLPDGYEAFLRTIYPPDWVRRLMDGSWDVFVGQVYPTFNRDIHEWRQVDPRTRQPLIPQFTRLIGGLDFGEPSHHAHKSAGMIAGVMPSGRILRLDEFVESGPEVALRQIRWMSEMEAKWGPHVKRPAAEDDSEWYPRCTWIADKSQMAIIQVLSPHFRVRPSKGGPMSVRWGIRLVADRLHVDGTQRVPGSFYLPHLREFPEAMERYSWPDVDDSKPAPTTPIKINDDLVDADRYMHEALQGAIGAPDELFRNTLPGYRAGPDGRHRDPFLFDYFDSEDFEHGAA